jgi:GT2 family glycosyltransferase
MSEQSAEPANLAAEPVVECPADFDEDAYAAAFPDIADSILAGRFKSCLDHYMRHGILENRLQKPRYVTALAAQRQLQAVSIDASAPPQRDCHTLSGLDTVLFAPSGLCLVIGWIDDRVQPLDAVSLQFASGHSVTSTAIARCRRADAEAAAGCPPGELLGFWSLLPAAVSDVAASDGSIVLHFGGNQLAHTAHPKMLQDVALRTAIFEYIATANYFGSASVESFLQLDGGAGRSLLNLNRAVSSSLVSHAYVERHGPVRPRYAASIIVCLYGRPEYLFLQAASFSMAPDAQEYEYVYICNSPELTEPLQREARIAAMLYGLSFTLIFLPGNAGFGAANNAAVAHASSDRIMIVNPDVFPRDQAWAQRHAAILATEPAAHTKMFGVPLFYDDGSLMHGGMYFDCDAGLSVKPHGITRQDLLRVEHYGKGAPPGTALYRRSRRVPAVTGAFISADRAWFEKLGGFSEDYVFGHYEDADLSLRCWQAGGEVWMHNLPMWHLEGKGSIRRTNHEGGSIVNRWHFTKTWASIIQPDFMGPDPLRLRA